MAEEQKTTGLRCAGCESAAPATAKPEPCGNWLCQSCVRGMRWAMLWQAAIEGGRGA
jgi:hypothetical protein